jgi:NAD(P)H dehydrogenase (quinone)
MKKITIIYYTRTGNTETMARLVEEGAESEGNVQVDVYKVGELSPEKILAYDGVIIGSPTYYGSMAGEIKKFLDETVSFHGGMDGKVGAAFSSSANIGGGNETTVTDILNAFLVHGMIVQGNPMGDHYGPVSIGKPDLRVAKQCRELGKRVAALVKKLA